MFFPLLLLAQFAAQPAVDQIFRAFDKPGTPGCSLGVLKDGKFVYQRGYGEANLEYSLPLRASSIFDIGSTSKQVVAFAVLLLEKEGKLTLADEVRKWVPALPDYGKPITLRHLLEHTSGLRDYLTLAALSGRGPDDFYTDPEVVQMIARQKELNFPPGEDFLYSNSGYFLLSQVAKAAAGMSLRRYAQEKIFGPLGMKSTHFHDDHTEIVPARATGYAALPSGGFRINMSTLDMIGDGGVYTSVEDLAKWDANFYSGQVGGAELVRRLQQRGELNNGKPLDYGLGLFLAEWRSGSVVRHGGSWAGFRAELLRIPGERFSVICLCNRADANPSALADQVARVWYPGFKMPEADRRTPPAKASAVPMGFEEAQRYTGRFRSEELDVIYRLFADREGLQLEFGREPKRRLLHVGQRRFTVRGLQLEFAEDGNAFRLQAGRVRNMKFVRLLD